MTSDAANQGGQAFSGALRFLKVFFLNSWRRFLIMVRYLLIGFQQVCLRRAWRLLGKRLHQVVAGGEDNPMLTAEVQDSLTKAQVIQETRDRHYQAIAALRLKMKASRIAEEAPPPEAEPLAEGEADSQKSQ